MFNGDLAKYLSIIVPIIRSSFIRLKSENYLLTSISCHARINNKSYAYWSVIVGINTGKDRRLLWLSLLLKQFYIFLSSIFKIVSKLWLIKIIDWLAITSLRTQLVHSKMSRLVLCDIPKMNQPKSTWCNIQPLNNLK